MMGVKEITWTLVLESKLSIISSIYWLCELGKLFNVSVLVLLW